MTTRTTLVFIGAGLGAVGAIAIAGDLNPPAGPVMPTMKTLVEVEPRVAVSAANTPGDADSVFKIVSPGSYYLTGNVLGVSGFDGIEIESSDVTLDLMGFTVEGVAGAEIGVHATGLYERVEVRNGVVRAWDIDGVRLAGPTSKVRNLTASFNGQDGVSVGLDAVVEGCTAKNNGVDGVNTSGAAVVSHCLAAANSSAGIRVSAGSTIVDSVANANGAMGVRTSGGCVVRGVSAFNNTGNGIQVFDNSVVAECSVFDNGAAGVSAAESARIVNCASELNGGFGVLAFDGSSIEGCTSNTDAAGGISVTNNTVVRNNTIHGMLGAGAVAISASGGDNRIDNNHVADIDTGVLVTSAGNIVMRNTVSGAITAYNIAASNKCFVLVPPSSAAFSGAVGGTSLSSDPWANFTF